MIENDSDGASSVAEIPTFFGNTFDEAHQLVLEARHYLGERGQRDVSALGVEGTLAYSVESMRLTARLTQVMAWLMAMRAVHEGELSREEVLEKQWRLGGHDVCLGAPTLDVSELPNGLQDLLQRSEQLFVRISRLDEMSDDGEA
jgi:regulator of CtrA degradation